MLARTPPPIHKPLQKLNFLFFMTESKCSICQATPWKWFLFPSFNPYQELLNGCPLLEMLWNIYQVKLEICWICDTWTWAIITFLPVYRTVSSAFIGFTEFLNLWNLFLFLTSFVILTSFARLNLPSDDRLFLIPFSAWFTK